MELGPRRRSRAPRPFALGHLVVQVRLTAERVALDVRPQSLGSIDAKTELEVHHLLENRVGFYLYLFISLSIHLSI